MIAVYGCLIPDQFLSLSTLQAAVGTQSSLLFLALAALCPLLVGEIDLSFASMMGVAATLVPVLEHQTGIWTACAIAVASGGLCGALNAIFVVRLRVASLIVTLGSGSLFLGLAEAMSPSGAVSLQNQQLSRAVATDVLGLPISFYFCLTLCAGMTYVLGCTPMGRSLLFVRSSREVARLAGVNVNRLRAMGYVAGGTIAGTSGVLLVGTVGGFDPSGAPAYLLPAFAAVFLGTAVVDLGRFNPMGTLLGVYFLETGIIGLQFLGYTGWVQEAFYGAGLMLAATVTMLLGRAVSGDRSETGQLR
ncbi:ABC transporter permease [Streptomyces sp. NPDC126514]|uniref:ABC transporter permease n=1 Tax=Streptomyces sp. NPDC126514 TaxID=3155210 RepID=UPI00331BEF79